MKHSQQFQLGPWRVCPKHNSISNGEQTRTLDNKSMQLLMLLIHEAGNTLSKDRIFEQVWAGKVVTTDILSVTMSKIRKALDDDARNPKFIKTIPNEGYVLVAQVQEIEREPHEVRTKKFLLPIKYRLMLGLIVLSVTIWQWILSREDGDIEQIHIDSIAVVPFEDLSAQQDSQYFAAGLSDEIIAQLSQIKSLKVISRDSSFRYQNSNHVTEIGRALQVENVLLGSIQKVSEQLRVQIRIVNSQSGQLLWSKRFDGKTSDAFELQDDVSTYLRWVISPHFQKGQPEQLRVNAQAYEWYLMGQYHWRQRSPEALHKAVSYFQHSLDLEPDYADAHIGLAISYAFLHTYGNQPELDAIDAAMPHISAALQFKPHSPMALATYGMLLSDKAKATGDFALYRQAKIAFEQSLAVQNSAITHLWYSTMLTRMGKQSDAVSHLEQAIVLNPLSAPLKRALSFLLMSMARPDSAQRLYQQALQLEANSDTRLLDTAKVNRHSASSISQMFTWHQQAPELFDTCSSIEVCEQQVLAYLSVGAKQAAAHLLEKMQPLHGHFRHTLHLLTLSEQKQNRQILARIQNRVFQLPYSAQARLELAYAQFRGEQFEPAKQTLLQLYPQWQNHSDRGSFDLTADNYQAVTLYAAVIKQLDNTEYAASLFQEVDKFLQQQLVFDQTQVRFVLAQVHAQLGNKKQALVYLSQALEMGWIESFHQQWWTLTQDHLLAPLQGEMQFKALLTQHAQVREDLRIRLNRGAG
ncbi:winged helix-turn-helix domain-containing protein [Pseudoalteromonas luteoviolacea]|uniref:OmpR/PhoB-type domain-containing protein n=1 Tax=Pseudoalteromonas luteoviolacea S4054 TaxID=1129367 RepID=A0A0F6AB10_9GAMM|nr:winged helix-turn-helix domain-containing protein [Pseudoalteromonas luteoviolacea]AOT06860.1 hypothetical protein S4054249_02755 [Pseudoalteromonas luteoviolacea]AOT11778.1 hypothetical protein S40542_02755 [Pseudoalteromonas luteoviolacea]AOT16690.1 hypothetical protein S4054_02755 [Pseudoalteromonas luteoviolacea]KKE83355.1 hypothetical protein N479_14530 [Pseudoalteromonas luteoviolacea S4054]KZN74028.1 hypothetical protein N481_09955 [Pseudoalteromonas luteoviolacea S4047-1]